VGQYRLKVMEGVREEIIVMCSKGISWHIIGGTEMNHKNIRKS
jgi:hypothetical protein